MWYTTSVKFLRVSWHSYQVRRCIRLLEGLSGYEIDDEEYPAIAADLRHEKSLILAKMRYHVTKLLDLDKE